MNLSTTIVQAIVRVVNLSKHGAYPNSYLFHRIVVLFPTFSLFFQLFGSAAIFTVFSRFNMHAACLFYLLTLLSFVSSYPVRNIRMSPSENLVHRLSRFVKRQKPQSSSIAAGSISAIPTFTSPASATLSTPSTNATDSPSVSATPSATGSIPQPSQPPATTDGSQKYVIAHHMVGNTFPYTVDDWTDDITLAHASGIDGFALNMGSDSWEPARVADA